MLEHPELLHEEIRVTPGREHEVPVEHGPLLLEDLHDLDRVHPETPSHRRRAASAGSGAAVIGRPTTMTSAPAARVSVADIVRRWSPWASPALRMPGTTSSGPPSL